MNIIGMVASQREVAGETACETRFFIGSLGTDVATFASAVRGHWGVENALHWRLDVAFRADDCRVREPAARVNLAVLRHIALTRLKHDTTKLGMTGKRLKAGWGERYLTKLLFEPPDSKTKSLSINNIDRQRDFPKRDDRCRQVIECDDATLQFFVTDQALTEPVKPTVGNVDHSSASALLGATFEFLRFLTPSLYMRDIAMRQDDLHGRLANVTGVGTYMLGTALGWIRALDLDGVQYRLSTATRHAGSRRSQRAIKEPRAHRPTDAACSPFFPRSVGFGPTCFCAIGAFIIALPAPGNSGKVSVLGQSRSPQ